MDLKHKAISKTGAINTIKRQPYFKLPDFRPLYCYSNKVLMAAAGEIGRIENVRFITINWRDRVKDQPFYGEVFGASMIKLVSHYAAKASLDGVSDPVFTWQGPLQRIRRQPFFGKDSSAPTTIKFRGPIPYTALAKENLDAMDRDDIFRDAVRFGAGISRIDPRDTWDMTIPVYTLEDICWNKMLDNAVLSK